MGPLGRYDLASECVISVSCHIKKRLVQKINDDIQRKALKHLVASRKSTFGDL